MNVIRRLLRRPRRYPKPARFGPFLLTIHGQVDYAAIPGDALLAEVCRDLDNAVWRLTVPQLGLEVTDPDLEELISEKLLAYVLDYFGTLRSLPEAYINEVEAEQLALYERLVRPWFSNGLRKDAIREARVLSEATPVPA